MFLCCWGDIPKKGSFEFQFTDIIASAIVCNLIVYDMYPIVDHDEV